MQLSFLYRRPLVSLSLSLRVLFPLASKTSAHINMLSKVVTILTAIKEISGHSSFTGSLNLSNDGLRTFNLRGLSDSRSVNSS
jgi:hypothetical protein